MSQRARIFMELALAMGLALATGGDRTSRAGAEAAGS